MRHDAPPFKADDKRDLHVYRWRPDDGVAPKGVVHISHGMAEHAFRYARVAEALVGAGYAVYANDHRGHGKTAGEESELGFIAPRDGFKRVVSDLTQLIAFEKGEHPGLPVFLFGHSMGSFIAQAYLIESGWALKGAVLSGSSGKPPAIAAAGKVLARIERARLGPRGKSQLLNSLSFDDYNKAFRPNRTAFDWLSRDNAEVDKYIADPRCGFVCSSSLWVDLLDLLSDNARAERQARVPSALPIYVFSGTEDPVGERTRSTQGLVDAYKRAGVKDVMSRFYAGGRHEMLNETNRDEVTRDLVGWLDAHVV